MIDRRKNFATIDTDSRNASPPIDFAKIRVGLKTLDDAVLSLGDYKKINPRLGDKEEVLKAIMRLDY